MVVAAPAHMMARSARIHSKRVPEAIPTRCSDSMPRLSSPAASLVTLSPVSAQVTDSQLSPRG